MEIKSINNKYLKQIGNKGSLKWIILIIIALVLASYFFDFSLQDAVEDEQTQSNFSYLMEHLIPFYDAYIRPLIEYLLETFTNGLEGIDQIDTTSTAVK